MQVRGLRVTVSHGKQMCVIGVIGDITRIDSDELLAYSYVEKVMNVTEPYKKANRLFHPEPTIVDVNGTKVGGGHLGIMAGPCSVESEEQVVAIAKAVKASGANFLRGGAFNSSCVNPGFITTIISILLLHPLGMLYIIKKGNEFNNRRMAYEC